MENNGISQRTNNTGHGNHISNNTRNSDAIKQVKTDMNFKNRRRTTHNPVYAFGSSTPRMLEPCNSDKSYWISRRATSTVNIMSVSLSVPPSRSSDATITRRFSEYEFPNNQSKTRSEFEKNMDTCSVSNLSAARRRTDLMPVVPSLRETVVSPTGTKTTLVVSKGVSMSRLDQLAQPRYRNKSPTQDLQKLSKLSIHTSKSMTHLTPKKKSVKCSAEFTLQLVPTQTVCAENSSKLVSERPRKLIYEDHPRKLACERYSFGSTQGGGLKSPVAGEIKKYNRLSAYIARNKQDNTGMSKRTSQSSSNLNVNSKKDMSCSTNGNKIESPQKPHKSKSRNREHVPNGSKHSVRKVKGDNSVESKVKGNESVDNKTDDSSRIVEINDFVENKADNSNSSNSVESKVDELSAVLGSLNDLAECDMAVMKTVFNKQGIKPVSARNKEHLMEQLKVEMKSMQQELETKKDVEENEVDLSQKLNNIHENELKEIEKVKDKVEDESSEAKKEVDDSSEGKEEVENEKAKENSEKQKAKEEAEKQKAKEDAEKQERDIELKLKQAMEERQARRKRVEAIMSRTRNQNSAIMTTSTDESVNSIEQEHITDDAETMKNSQMDMISV